MFKPKNPCPWCNDPKPEMKKSKDSWTGNYHLKCPVCKKPLVINNVDIRGSRDYIDVREG